MSPEQIAWLAGIFDGEGNIAWPRRKNIHAVRINVTNTCRPLLERIAEITGTGSLIDGGKFRRSEKHNKPWYWNCHGENARELLRIMSPWLISKKHNTAVVLEAVQKWKETGKPDPSFAERVIQPRRSG